MSQFNVRNKVLIPLSLTFAVLILAFVWAGYGIRASGERVLLQQHFWSAQSVLNGLLADQVGALTSTAEFIAGQPSLQRAMALRDIKGLTAISTPLLDRLKNRLNITHFYYYDPQGNLILRVYFPEDVTPVTQKRITLQRAMHSGQPEVGLEVGRHGTFAQRLYYPWYRDNTLIGYIELGKDLKPILEKLKQITKVDMTIAIDKTSVNRSNWEKYAEKFPPPFPWDFHPDKIISDSTIELPSELATRILNGGDYGTLEETFSFAQQTFRGALLPVTDVQGGSVGELLMLVNTTGHKAAFYNFLFWVIGLSLLLSGALFAFSYRILGRVEQRLTISQDRLAQESASLAEANINLQKEINTRTFAEKELILLNQTLEQRVADRTGELEQQNALLAQNSLALEKAYAELKQKRAAILHQDKMACIGQLAAGIAHDINNPVGFISHNLTLFERYFQRMVQLYALQKQLIKTRASAEMLAACEKGWQDFKIDEVFREIPIMLQECQDGTSRIAQIVQGLRSFIRSEPLKYELTDLRQCLDGSLTLLRHELGGRIRVVKEYGPVPLLYSYTQQMNQVFMNLLLNACQAIEKNGEIRIATWSENQQIHVEISDTGCGIPQDHLEKIYEPFFSTKPIGVGTGLGLSIVYEVMNRHNGTLAVASEVGRGTTFTLTFPFDKRKVPRKDVAGSGETGAGDGHG